MRSSSRSQIAGTENNGEYWLRCPFCGDSDKNKTKAHFSVKIESGIYNCYRCSSSGKLNTKQTFDLFGFLPGFQLENEAQEPGISSEDRYDMALEQLLPGPGSNRATRLSRHHMQYGEYTWDMFKTFDYPEIEEIGLLGRVSGKDKRSMFFGDRGWAWPGCEKGIRPEGVLRFVEGPYDVLEENDVCVFGFISFPSVQPFFTKDIILCPDGDIWTQPDLKRAFYRTIHQLLNSPKPKPNLLGVEILPRGLDPDECPPDQRGFIGINQLMSELADRRRSYRQSTLLSDLQAEVAVSHDEWYT